MTLDTGQPNSKIVSDGMYSFISDYILGLLLLHTHMKNPMPNMHVVDDNNFLLYLYHNNDNQTAILYVRCTSFKFSNVSSAKALLIWTKVK